MVQLQLLLHALPEDLRHDEQCLNVVHLRLHQFWNVSIHMIQMSSVTCLSGGCADFPTLLWALRNRYLKEKNSELQLFCLYPTNSPFTDRTDGNTNCSGYPVIFDSFNNPLFILLTTASNFLHIQIQRLVILQWVTEMYIIPVKIDNFSKILPVTNKHTDKKAPHVSVATQFYITLIRMRECSKTNRTIFPKIKVSGDWTFYLHSKYQLSRY